MRETDRRIHLQELAVLIRPTYFPFTSSYEFEFTLRLFVEAFVKIICYVSNKFAIGVPVRVYIAT
jgi:hypothetical protein